MSDIIAITFDGRGRIFRLKWLNDRAGFWRGRFLPPVLHCVIRKFGYLQK